MKDRRGYYREYMREIRSLTGRPVGRPRKEDVERPPCETEYVQRLKNILKRCYDFTNAWLTKDCVDPAGDFQSAEEDQRKARHDPGRRCRRRA